jgi:urease accessory protein UreF
MKSLIAAALGLFVLTGGAFAATDAVTQCQSETLATGTYVYQDGVFTAIEDGTMEGAAALNACVQAKASAKTRAPRARVLNIFTLLPPEREPRCSITLVGGTGYMCRPTRY